MGHTHPARGAWRGDTDARGNRARDELAGLFGLAPESQESDVGGSLKPAADPRRVLDALFEIESDADSESASSDSEGGRR